MVSRGRRSSWWSSSSCTRLGTWCALDSIALALALATATATTAAAAAAAGAAAAADKLPPNELSSPQTVLGGAEAFNMYGYHLHSLGLPVKIVEAYLLITTLMHALLGIYQTASKAGGCAAILLAPPLR